MEKFSIYLSFPTQYKYDYREKARIGKFTLRSLLMGHRINFHLEQIWYRGHRQFYVIDHGRAKLKFIIVEITFIGNLKVIWPG